MDRFYGSDRFSDLSLKFGDREVKVHRIVLCSQSTWFEHACEGGFKEASGASIELHEDNPLAVQAMLHHMYGLDPMDLCQDSDTAAQIDSIVQFYATAEKYQVQKLSKLMTTKFEEAIEKNWQSLWDCGELSGIIDTIYDLTSASNDQVRSATIVVMSKHLAEYRRTEPDKLQDLLTDHPGFSCDLVLWLASDAKVINKKFNALNAPLYPHKTELHWAAQYGNVERCQVLISQGIHVDSQDENGETPLHFATYCGQLATTQYLLDQGANINATSHRFPTSTPLTWAKSQGFADVVAYLSAHGAIELAAQTR